MHVVDPKIGGTETIALSGGVAESKIFQCSDNAKNVYTGKTEAARFLLG